MILTGFLNLLSGKNNKKIKNFNKKVFSEILFLFLLFTIINQTYIFLLHHFIALSPTKPTSYPRTNRFIILIIILAPLIEELICRLPLIYNRNNISISAGLFSGLIAASIFKIKLLSSFQGILILFAFPAILYILLDYYKDWIDPFLNKFWDKYFQLIFYLSATIFSLLHINNYQINNTKDFILLPLLLSVYFLAGLELGYIRIKYGIIWSWLFHILHNFITLILLHFLTNH